MLEALTDLSPCPTKNPSKAAVIEATVGLGVTLVAIGSGEGATVNFHAWEMSFKFVSVVYFGIVRRFIRMVFDLHTIVHISLFDKKMAN